MKLLLLLIATCYSFALAAQTSEKTVVKNTRFPESWDKNRDLRSRNGKVLAWAHLKNGKIWEYKSCITLIMGTDSAGKMEYFISKMVTDKKPFNKWHYGWIYYSPNFSDTANKFSIGYYDLHLERFDHKPTKKEIYDLLIRWKFSFYDKADKTLEAGIDKTLWLKTFGFEPDVERIGSKN